MSQGWKGLGVMMQEWEGLGGGHAGRLRGLSLERREAEMMAAARAYL